MGTVRLPTPTFDPLPLALRSALRVALRGTLGSALGFGGTLGCSPPPAESPRASEDASEERPALPREEPLALARRLCTELVPFAEGATGGETIRVVAAEHAKIRGVEHCVVELRLAGRIGARLQLPMEGWTGRYLQLGCGGLCGRIQFDVPAANRCPLFDSAGFAVATTDMGHEGGGGEFGADPERRADFAHRAVHLTSLAAKTIIERYYGERPHHSYFSGCSDGGREGLVEAQRYPEDFDGILAGAPALNFQVQKAFFHSWQARSNSAPDGQAIVTSDRLGVLHHAVLARCDALDGRKDGLVDNPLACDFDPNSVLCDAGATSSDDCWTKEEVEVARKFFAGPRDPKTGERLTLGGPLFGSELAWSGLYVPKTRDERRFSEELALEAIRYLNFEGPVTPQSSLADLNFSKKTLEKLRSRHPLFDATNPDLSSFEGRGGKLILWHGWADPQISPLNTIAYHQAIARHGGAERASTFERLYLLPGVFHCGGGEGPSELDLLTPLVAWVERGKAPFAVELRFAEAPRPAPTPTSAEREFHGEPGSPSEVSSSQLAPSHVDPTPYSSPAYPVPDWAGADFFTPYAPRAH